MSKIPGLFVVSRNSTFTYKGKTTSPRQVAADLGVRYVLEGSVRRIGDDVRINVQLTDATTGGHLWAERYDGRLFNVLSLPEKVTTQVAGALALDLTAEAQQRLGRLGTENMEAHDAYLMGLSYYFRRTPEGFAEARDQFRRAIELDPDYAAPRVAIAKIYAQVRSIAYSRALEINFFEAGAKARTELALVDASESADGHVVLSWLALNKHQHRQAIAEAEQALKLDPNNVDAMEALAQAKIYSGEMQAGIELAEAAMRQNPAVPTHPLLLMGLAEFASDNPSRAVSQIERAFDLGSEEVNYAGILAAAYGLMGRVEDARVAFASFSGGFTEAPDLSRSVETFPFLRLGSPGPFGQRPRGRRRKSLVRTRGWGLFGSAPGGPAERSGNQGAAGRGKDRGQGLLVRYAMAAAWEGRREGRIFRQNNPARRVRNRGEPGRG